MPGKKNSKYGSMMKKSKGGKIARGCGKVMSNRRKYTTTS